MGKLITDIQHENFELYFGRSVEHLAPYQKEKLPKETTFKLFRRGGVFSARSTNKLSFLEKIFVLWKALNRRIYIIVEDHENGLDTEAFLKLREDEKKKRVGNEQANEMIVSSTFVLASKELCQTLSYLNEISVSPIYNYLQRFKNTPKSKIADYKHQMNQVMRFFSNYEATKKKMVMESGLNMPEFLVLIYIYNGEITQSSHIYKEVYRYCFQSSKTRIKQAFGSLQVKGYIEKIGVGRYAQIRITVLGTSKINEVTDKYFKNF